ncbi:MAG TPA: hypothetical protein VLR92_09200 [Blastocatellia bacterium]|nr:hypothetical protein [Blastocatellia bacterium]
MQVNTASAGVLARTSVRSTLNSRKAPDAGAFSRFALIAGETPALAVFTRSVQVRLTLLDKAEHFIFTTFALLLLAVSAQAQVRITIDHNDNKTANAEFRFARVPSPARNDAGAKAILTLVDAEADGNSADISALNDGLLPDAEDQPRKNFFLNTGSGGGRLRMDLGSVTGIAQVNSYSWHSNSRGPQVYRVWASDGTAQNFNAEPKGTIDPTTCGWKSIAIVDTRTDDEDGGQYGVSIADASGSLGKFRYLLFDLYPVEVADNAGNTFYSEIDVVTKK